MAVRLSPKAAPLELGRDDIRVNSVHLRRIDATMADEDLGRVASSTVPADTSAIWRSVHPIEVTRLVLFLASSDASFSTARSS